MGTDNRPKTVEYLTAEIFAPTCGAAQCHSTFAGNVNDVFDTVIGVRSSIVGHQLVRLDSLDPLNYDPDNSSQAPLIQWITQTDPFGFGIGRMPYDAPMPIEDVDLLKAWIEAKAPGAQCNPGVSAGLTCNGNSVVQCDDNWNFSTEVQDCSKTGQGCVNGACK